MSETRKDLPQFVKILIIVAGMILMFFMGVLVSNWNYERQLNRIGRWGIHDDDGFSSGPGFPHLMMVEKWKKLLDITEEQEEEIKEILQSHREEFMELRTDTRTSIEDLMDEIAVELEDILSDEQKATLNEFLNDRFGFDMMFPHCSK